MELKGYLTNLGKYNEGELVGTWVEFPCTDEEYNKAMKEIGAGEVPYEETFWTDWDCDIEGISDGLGEYVSYEKVNEIAEMIDEIGDDDKVTAIVEAYGVDELQNADNYDFIPYDSFYDTISDHAEGLGYYIVENYYGGLENLDADTLEYYFDYKAFGETEAMDYYETETGYIN